jgi:hypothetical protein
MRTSARLGAFLAGTALVLGLAGAVPAVSAGATTAPTFSAPVWFPLASPVLMGCVEDNPGCPAAQVSTYWSWDIRGQNETAHEYHQKIFAMGSGIVHVLYNHQGCGAAHENHGNTLWINHGNGVISTYEHLSSHFLVKDGDQVTARTPIAHMGQSGYTGCQVHPSVRFVAIAVKHGVRIVHGRPSGGDYIQVKHTDTCVHGTKTSWPQQLPGNDGSWTRWYHVPVGTPIPNTSDHRSCVSAQATAG